MKLNFKILGACLVAGVLLAACSEPPEIAAKVAKRPDVAPYMGADNGFMTRVGHQAIRKVGRRRLISAIRISLSIHALSDQLNNNKDNEDV